jgi:hypothetical protein
MQIQRCFLFQLKPQPYLRHITASIMWWEENRPSFVFLPSAVSSVEEISSLNTLCASLDMHTRTVSLHQIKACHISAYAPWLCDETLPRLRALERRSCPQITHTSCPQPETQREIDATLRGSARLSRLTGATSLDTSGGYSLPPYVRAPPSPFVSDPKCLKLSSASLGQVR